MRLNLDLRLRQLHAQARRWGLARRVLRQLQPAERHPRRAHGRARLALGGGAIPAPVSVLHS